VNKKYNITNVKDFFKNSNCTLISKEYNNYEDKLDYICKCGKINKISFAHFKNGTRCRECGFKKTSDFNRFRKLEDVKKIFEIRKCKLLSNNYINNRQKLEYMCEKGHLSSSSLGNFINGFGCRTCSSINNGKNLRHSYEFVNNFFKYKNCKLISKIYDGKDKPLDYVCECGNNSKISFANFKKGNRCKECAKIRRRITLYKSGTAPASKQQKRINKLLNGELNYPLGKFSLDIAFLNDKIAIEYDGSGHKLMVTKKEITEEHFIKKESKRYNFIKRSGWKVLRILSYKDLLPNDEILKELIISGITRLKDNVSYYIIDFNNMKIKCSQFEENIKCEISKTK